MHVFLETRNAITVHAWSLSFAVSTIKKAPRILQTFAVVAELILVNMYMQDYTQGKGRNKD